MAADLPNSTKPALSAANLDALIASLNSRDAHYATGVEMLKDRMIPALMGHDYVPPYAKFNDSSTIQDLKRGPYGMSLHDYFKSIESGIENKQYNVPPYDPTSGTYPFGFNGSNKT